MMGMPLIPGLAKTTRNWDTGICDPGIAITIVNILLKLYNLLLGFTSNHSLQNSVVLTSRSRAHLRMYWHFRQSAQHFGLVLDCMPFPLHQLPIDSDFRFQNASEFPSLSARCIDAWNFLARCNTLYKQSVVGDVIISFSQHYFYWNLCKAMLLFQLISVLLISVTFYTYLTNIIFVQLEL